MTEPAAQPAEPLPTASDADLAEQHQPAVPDPDDGDGEVAVAPSPTTTPIEADPADAFEQQLPVPELDEYR